VVDWPGAGAAAEQAEEKDKLMADLYFWNASLAK
jgi:hypothetical protein